MSLTQIPCCCEGGCQLGERGVDPRAARRHEGMARPRGEEELHDGHPAGHGAPVTDAELGWLEASMQAGQQGRGEELGL